MFLSISNPSSHGQDFVWKDLRKVLIKNTGNLNRVRSQSYPILFSLDKLINHVVQTGWTQDNSRWNFTSERRNNESLINWNFFPDEKKNSFRESTCHLWEPEMNFMYRNRLITGSRHPDGAIEILPVTRSCHAIKSRYSKVSKLSFVFSGKFFFAPQIKHSYVNRRNSPDTYITGEIITHSKQPWCQISWGQKLNVRVIKLLNSHIAHQKPD